VTLYYWRVQANNACGIGANSAAWSFTTAAIVCNPGAIAIPSSGAASPYPSTIAVSGLVGQVTDVNVYLEDMNHTWPSDIDILLVGPQGQNIILMSDAGSSFDLVTVDLVFDDAAAGSLPVSAQITSGAYQPTNFGAGDPFPAPAPAPSAATALATFDGANPNGAWSLYVVDDTGGDQGSIAGGWCLEVGAQIPVEPPNIDVDPLSMSSTQPVNTTTQQTLDVGNTGEADLTWAIQEEPAQTVEAQKAPSISPTKLDAPAAVQRSAKALQDLLNSRMADAVLDAHGGSGAVCSNPGDVPWLSVSPTHGTTAPAATTAVDVTFDATGLAAGVYNANLCVSNNDPDPGPGNETDLVIVPVELTVLAEPSIVITKTVGTAPGVCATTREIDVAAGATVYYCYTVTNTGDATLNLHTLVDDQLGQLFTGFAYALTPGSSVSTVDAGLVFSAVIDELTTNVATWTAYDPQGRSATATATATVTVAPPTAVTLDSLNATPAAVAGSLALLALPAVVSLALGAAYALRRRAE
jgi:subtilisin-like proprotein convertase family protein